jgi:hypothetical protein
VFAEAHSDRYADKTIAFTDPELETAAVLRVFFTTITTMRVPLAQFEGKDLTVLTTFLFFLRKWDAKNIYAVTLDSIHTAVKAGRLYPLRVFQLGALLDEVETCCVALGNPDYGDPWWGPWFGKHHDKMHHYPFNPCGWTPRFYLEHKIPTVYLAALSQAMGLEPSSPGPYFLRYLEKAKEALKAHEVEKARE